MLPQHEKTPAADAAEQIIPLFPFFCGWGAEWISKGFIFASQNQFFFSLREGSGSVKEEPFAGSSFASSEAENPPEGGGCHKATGLPPNKKDQSHDWSFCLVGADGFEPS